MQLSETDLSYLRQCVDLAAAGMAEGNGPFGSVLVAADGEVLFSDHNRESDGDGTQHPEFAIARWAANQLSPSERAAATVYTSGEHCPMCAAAHGWVGLGRIVYAVSSDQLSGWRAGWGAPSAPVAALPITAVVPDAVVDGPADELVEELKALHRAAFERAAAN